MLEDGEIGDDGGVAKTQRAIQTARCSHSAHVDRTIMRYREHFVAQRRIQPLPRSQLVCRMQLGGNGRCELVRQFRTRFAADGERVGIARRETPLDERTERLVNSLAGVAC